MNQEKIGKFIAKLRKEKNMTQAQLAEKMGVTDKSISRWENGKTMPDVSLFEPLCNELNISINELLKGEKTENTNDTDNLSAEALMGYSKYLKIKEKRKIILLALFSFITLILFSALLLLTCNRTFFKTRYNSEFLDNVSIAIPKYSYYRRTGGNYISTFKTLKSTDEIDVFIDTYLSSFEKIECNGETYYYNSKNDYTIFQYTANNDGYGFINTIYIGYCNGKYCGE